MVLFTRLLFTFSLLVSTFQGFGQVSFDNKEDLEKAANEKFEAQNYSEAKPLFSQLLSKDALDPNYNYRFGVCILFTEADPLKPLPYIEGGANSAGVNKEAHFYLGKAYQFNYRFEDAITAFQKAKSSGFTGSDIDLDRNIKECLNGKVLYNAAIDFKPAQNKEVIASEFYRPYDFRKLKGKVIPMPPNFKTKYDEKNLSGTVVYTPSNSNILVYASYGEDGVNGKDLYRVNRLPTGEWALPQRLPDAINTKYDEDYAFYDKDSNTLFFASKGHNTMGGYDVFSSTYNADADNWSTPVNLQYPVNSPFDDFLYIGDPNGKVAFFTTARNTVEGKLRVFKTLLHDPKQVELSIVEGTFTDQTDSVYNYMSVTVLDPITNRVVGKYRSHKETGKYVLILPPQNDYTMDVGPREAEGFKFELDVPNHEPTKPLTQGITYDASSDKGTVTLTNYFDATGKPDSLALAESRPLQEVVDQMVAMPDPAEILAAREEVRLAKEKEVADAIAAEKAEEARIQAEIQAKAQAEALAAQQAEEARLLAEKEASEQASMALKKAEELAQKEAQKVKEDSIAEVELALQIEAEALAQQAEMKKAAVEKEKAEMIAKNAAIQAENDAMRDEANMIEKQVDVALELAEKQKNVSQDDIDKALEIESEALAQQTEVAKAKEDELKAATKAKEDSLRAANLAAQIAMEEAKQQELEIAKQEEESARLLAEKESAKQDSIANSELAQLAEAKRQQAVEDSILRAKQELAIAEKARLDQISQEVELAKEQALRDSAEKIVAEQNDLAIAEDESFEQILKEMEEKEAELLLEQALAAQSLENKESEALSVNEGKEIELAKETVQVEIDGELSEASEAQKKEAKEHATPEIEKLNSNQANAEQETLSESELFLETIAKIEAQKAEQEQLIEKENALLAQVKKEREEKEVEAAKASETASVKEGSTNSAVEESEAKLTEEIEEEIPEMENEIVALKSNADPNEYLKALNEIEAEIAEEAKSNPKEYTVRPLEGKETDAEEKKQIDPVLQESINADRLALAQHQKIASEKEQTLRDQMQRDKDLVGGYDEALTEELADIDKEVEQLEAELNGSPEPVVEEVKEEVGTIPSPEVETEDKQEQELHEIVEEELAAVETEEVQEVVAQEEVVVQEVEKKVEVEELEAVAETTLDKEVTLEEVNSEETAEVTSEIVEEVVAEKSLESRPVEEATQPTTDVAEAIEEKEEKLDIESEKAETEIVEDSAEDDAIAEILNEAESEWTEPVVESTEPQTPEMTVAKPAERVVTVGTIPFLTAAIRNPDKSKPSFKGIEDKGLRRMIKRMRAEDVGRLAVIKNIKNEKIDAGGDVKAIEDIEGNLRNQDVLANASANSREEYIRPQFDKSHLKERKGVYYKLQFAIKTMSVSETILETMTPEMEMTFAMPEFDLKSEYYKTYADVNSGYREYTGRGFTDIKVIPYLKGEPTTLSAVQEIPFID